MSSVNFNHITKLYEDGTRALTDFNLHIEQGELMVLVGPSGCGKSTALRLLAGLTSPTEGDLFIDQVLVNDLTPQQRNIAMVFQNYALYPHMSVRRNLEFPLRMSKLSQEEINQRTQWAADMLQLSELMERKPQQLSGGQRQRVAMGRAIVREPQVFLMDEPLSNLDAKLRVQIRSNIGELQRRLDITMMYVTHDQVEAMTLGDRVAVMHEGRLQQVDFPQALYQQPANRFVAQFIGSPGMNICSSRLQKKDSKLEFEFAGEWLGLADNIETSLQAYIDQAIYFGIRPEHITVANDDSAQIRLPLKTIETLGHEQLLYFDYKNQTNGANIIVRYSGNNRFSIGDQVSLRLDKQKLYFFDQQGITIHGHS